MFSISFTKNLFEQILVFSPLYYALEIKKELSVVQNYWQNRAIIRIIPWIPKSWSLQVKSLLLYNLLILINYEEKDEWERIVGGNVDYNIISISYYLFYNWNITILTVTLFWADLESCIGWTTVKKKTDYFVIMVYHRNIFWKWFYYRNVLQIMKKKLLVTRN